MNLLSEQKVEVAAGLICKDGRFLITRRPEGAHLEGFWEFPGGKIEQGESEREALERELEEEIGIEASAGEHFHTIEHEYPERTVLLHFYICHVEADQQPRPIECEEITWVKRSNLDQYPFPPADEDLLNKLQSHQNG